MTGSDMANQRNKRMVQRTATHVTDTLAVRAVIRELDDSWLVRSLDERDYGIDMTLEIFDGHYPTGHLILAQIKGRKGAFPQPVKLSTFPVRTLLYAELFLQPFFVFYHSRADGRTYFVWLQNYIRAKLDHDSPSWREQKSVTIEFPPDNLLATNKNRIVEMAKKQKLRDAGVSFLSSFEWLRLHSAALVTGNTKLAPACLSQLEGIRRFVTVWDEMGNPTLDLDLDALEGHLKRVSKNHRINTEVKEKIVDQIKQLDGIKTMFLGVGDIDRLAVEMSNAYPY